MKIFQFKNLPGGVLSLSLAFLGTFAGFMTDAVGADQHASANASCRQETRRVAVWPKGAPKAAMVARFEERAVTICGAIPSRQSPDVQLNATGSGK